MKGTGVLKESLPCVPGHHRHWYLVWKDVVSSLETWISGSRGCSSVVKPWPSRYGALGSIPTKTNKTLGFLWPEDEAGIFLFLVAHTQVPSSSCSLSKPRGSYTHTHKATYLKSPFLAWRSWRPADFPWPSCPGAVVLICTKSGDSTDTRLQIYDGPYSWHTLTYFFASLRKKNSKSLVTYPLKSYSDKMKIK